MRAGEAGEVHWLGAECPCRPEPAERDGFAGVIHRVTGGPLFFEAQACLEHQLHHDSLKLFGLTAAPLCRDCDLPAQGPYTEQEAVRLAIAAMAPSNLGGTDA